MDPALPLIGFDRELARVRRTLQRGEPLLVLGPRGCGKTKLLREALTSCGSGVIYVRSENVLHDFLVSLAQSLISARHPPAVAAFGGKADSQRLASQTSVHLRGLLWTAVERVPVTIVLDAIEGAGMRNYRFLQRIYHTPGVSMIAAARNYRCLDALGRLFWDPRRVLNIGPLKQTEAVALFDRLVRWFNLGHLELADFRERVMDAAQGNPGEIVEMCRLAAQPQYQYGSRVKFAPLRIDTIARMGAVR